MPGRAVEYRRPESAVQTIQFNLGENAIDDSKAKSITTAIAEAEADLFDSRELWARGFGVRFRMP